MKKSIVLTCLLMVLCAGCGSQSSDKAKEANAASENEQNTEEHAVVKNVFDFALPTVNGAKLNILDEIKQHKITVIDFWASWCAPCRGEMPNMVSLYNKYQEQGLGIIGISLDQNTNDWMAAMDALGIVWPSTIDEYGSAATSFKVEYIPYTLVVNAEGDILNTNLRGEELEAVVANLLNS